MSNKRLCIDEINEVFSVFFLTFRKRFSVNMLNLEQLT